MVKVLALETSCDESAAAVVEDSDGRLQVLSHRIASQIEEHAQWGGVVPEIASRRHVEALPHLIDQSLIFRRFLIQLCLQTSDSSLTGKNFI